MIQIFTPNDLIRYIYDEMTEVEAHKLEETLLFDEELSEAYQQLNGAFNQVTAKKYACDPSDRAVNNILNYSKSIDLHAIDK